MWWAGLWLQLDRSVLTRVPILDEAFYLEAGADIASGAYLPAHPFIMSPLYPYLVAATGGGRRVHDTGWREGSPPLGLRLLQLACWLGTIWLLWRMGRRLGWGRLAVGPPLLFALYRPAAIFTTTSLLEMPLTFVTVAYLYGLHDVWADAERRRQIFLLGALLGAAALLRASALLLLVPAWVLGWRTARGRRQAAHLTLVVALLLFPVVLINSVKANRLCGVSCNGGLNLYIGNGPEATGLYVAFAGFDVQDDPAGAAFLSARLARQVAGVGEADAIWASAAWDQMRSQPLRAASLWLKKVWLHFVGWEIPQVTPLSFWRQHGPLLNLLWVPYSLIVALGLLGAGLGWRQPQLRVWILAVVVLVAGQSLFFVVSRYRLIIVPLLCLLAGEGVRTMLGWRGKSLVRGLMLVVCALALVQPWGLSALRAQWDALSHGNLAYRWEKLSTAEATTSAEHHYRLALEIDPSLVMAYRGLARTLDAQGRKDEAAEILAAGVLRSPQADMLLRDLILRLLAADRIHDVLPRLAAYLSDHPDDPEMLHNYVVALARTGRQEAALAAARDLMTRIPNDPRGFVDLGVLLARSGNPAEAREVFEAGLARHPDNAELQHNLKILDAP
jgi:Flp pilus assembly protein TadD